MDPKRAQAFAKIQTLLEILGRIEHELSSRSGIRESPGAAMHFVALGELIACLRNTLVSLAELWEALPRDSMGLQPRNLGGLDPGHLESIREEGYKIPLRSVSSCLDYLSAVVGHISQALLPTDPFWLHQTVHTLAMAFPPLSEDGRPPSCLTVAPLPSALDFPGDDEIVRSEEIRRSTDFAFHYFKIYGQTRAQLEKSVEDMKKMLLHHSSYPQVLALEQVVSKLPQGRDVFFQQVPYMLGHIIQLASIVTHEIGHYVVRHKDNLKHLFRKWAEEWVDKNLQIVGSTVAGSTVPRFHAWLSRFKVLIATEQSQNARQVLIEALERNIEEIFCDCNAVYSIGAIPLLSICQRFDLRFERGKDIVLTAPNNTGPRGTPNYRQHQDLWLGYYSHPSLIIRLLAMTKICAECWDTFSEFCTNQEWELFNNGGEFVAYLLSYLDSDANLRVDQLLDDTDSAYELALALNKTSEYGRSYSFMSRGERFVDSVSQSHVFFYALVDILPLIIAEVQKINDDKGYSHPKPRYLVGQPKPGNPERKEPSILEPGWGIISAFASRNLPNCGRGFPGRIDRNSGYEEDRTATIRTLNELLKEADDQQLKFVHLFALTYFVFLAYAQSSDGRRYLLSNDLITAYFAEYGTICHS